MSTVVTQNVDSLHYKAGSKNVIELHGTAFRVICLNCKATYSRYDIQEKLRKANPEMCDTSSMIRPDGDVDIPQVVILYICSLSLTSVLGIFEAYFSEF